MSGLYEELGVPKDASSEQIRKAYKKRALQTHPDRLPPNATAAEKAVSEEKFRKVNNAYEVLIDAKKRSEYDIHGIWPPPEVDVDSTPYMPSGSRHRTSSRPRRSSRNQTFPDPFFSHYQHHPYSSFQFTDPFTLFNSIFEELNPSRGPSRQRQFPFSADPFERMNRFHSEIDSLMEDVDRDTFGLSGFPRFGHFPPMPVFPPLDRSPHDSGRGKWISESYMTSTVNGVTQTIKKRVDSDGNEHVTRTLPDGREIRTINGVEQPVAGQLPYNDSSTSRRLPEPSGDIHLSPIATHSQPMLNAPRDYDSPPPYTSHSTAYRTQSSTLPNEHREPQRSRRSSEKYYANNNIANNFEHQSRTTDTHRKKKWWHY